MAPEYAMRGYLTSKADVYSFGVVALETVSGKSNTNYRPIEEFVYLLDWVIIILTLHVILLHCNFIMAVGCPVQSQTLQGNRLYITALRGLILWLLP